VTNSRTLLILADSTGTCQLHNGLLNFKKAGQNPPSLELLIETIEILLEAEPAKRLDLTPRVRKIVDNRKSARENGGGRNKRRSTYNKRNRGKGI
jgi:hypothetical protein